MLQDLTPGFPSNRSGACRAVSDHRTTSESVEHLTPGATPYFYAVLVDDLAANAGVKHPSVLPATALSGVATREVLIWRCTNISSITLPTPHRTDDGRVTSLGL